MTREARDSAAGESESGLVIDLDPKAGRPAKG